MSLPILLDGVCAAVAVIGGLLAFSSPLLRWRVLAGAGALAFALSVQVPLWMDRNADDWGAWDSAKWGVIAGLVLGLAPFVVTVAVVAGARAIARRRAGR